MPDDDELGELEELLLGEDGELVLLEDGDDELEELGLLGLELLLDSSPATSQQPIVGVPASRVVPLMSVGMFVASGVPFVSSDPVSTARKSLVLETNWLANVSDV